MLSRANQTNQKLESLLNRIGEVPAQNHTPARPPQQFTQARPVLGIRCPQCKKRALRRATKVNFTDRLAALVLLRKMRCRYCRYTELRFVFDKS
ncbi:hypothetical protein [Nevskia soli]|uniref:hypothetical protein n=1 Tax=Nevskia soli TaxID=418856 RepID=UPI0015D74157|nr:hypothetical protein [Nevskia soli]